MSFIVIVIIVIMIDIYSALIKSYNFEIVEQSDVKKGLLGSMLAWLIESNDLFWPSKQVFAALLDAIALVSLKLMYCAIINFILLKVAEVKCDETNFFVLETALNHPKLISYLAQHLQPRKVSSNCFLRMYRLIQERLTYAPPHVSFVLLSKVCVVLIILIVIPANYMLMIIVIIHHNYSQNYNNSLYMHFLFLVRRRALAQILFFAAMLRID